MTPVQVSTLVALCPRDHPLAESETVTLSELAKYPMVDLRPGWTTRRVTDLAFEREGIVRQWACEVNDLTLLVRLVEHGLGVCIAPRAVERMNLDVHVLRIMPPLPEWALAIHYLESRTVPAAARVLIDMLEERLTRVASDAPVTGRAGGRRSGGVNGG
jgi:DNA-binding transcriptional LysR family regulator